VALAGRLARLEALARRRPANWAHALDALRADRAALFRRAGITPDDWQAKQLRSEADRVLLLCSRQAGKSTTAAGLALGEALLTPMATILLLSPSERQSGELFRKVVGQFDALGRPVPAVRETALQLELATGSRVIALPGKEGTVRGYSEVALLVIDEAARVDDALYYAVRPMLAVSKGKLVALSTPFGQRGWFHAEWSGTGTWERVRVTAAEVPRISSEFLAEERRALGERWYRQEYCCSFEDTIDAVFAYEDIQAALSNEVKPLFAV
jgi:Terminase large subunit, T4likevirus-type, N-terminal